MLKKISEKFDDNLTDLANKKSFYSKNEKDDIDKVKKRTNDVKNDILKSIGRTSSIGTNILTNIIFYFSWDWSCYRGYCGWSYNSL